MTRAYSVVDQTESLLTVRGGHRISGRATTSGFKHSLVTVVAAALSARRPVWIENCPDIAETHVLASLITKLGGSAVFAENVLSIDAKRIDSAELDEREAARIHGSAYLIPALLARFGTVRMPPTGGCRIGDAPGGRRPTHHYVSVLERFGATVTTLPDGEFVATARTLTGCEIDLLDYADRALRSGPLYSGATKAALLTAAVARGDTVLRNPYPKPDVTDLVDMLRMLGTAVDAEPDGSLIVRGRAGETLDRPVVHTLVPDLIEVITWLCAGALLGSSPLTVTGPGMDRACHALAPELDVLHRMGVRIDVGADSVVVHPADRIRPVDVVVASHGVFSDSQPFLALLAACADGSSSITETVWSGRFGYAAGLRAFGVRLDTHGRTLRVHGPWVRRQPAERVHGGDLRAAAMLLLAALAVPGTTVLSGSEHLVRGYADLAGALRALGADITTGKSR